MEKLFQISTDDDHIIYGTLNSKNESNSLIIFVHGFTGSQNEHIHFNGSKFFNEHGFDTFRFDLYSGEEKGRLLEETSLEIHSKDVNAVISIFENEYKNIFLIGHSLGGPVIGLSNLDTITSICLWDPSIRLDTFVKKEPHRKIWDSNYLLLDWGPTVVTTKNIFEDWNNFNDENFVQSLISPVKIIVGKIDCCDHEHWPDFLDLIPSKYEYLEMERADHCFNAEGVEEELFAETLTWFENNLKESKSGYANTTVVVED